MLDFSIASKTIPPIVDTNHWGGMHPYYGSSFEIVIGCFFLVGTKWVLDID
jgi:hypothetical protein